MRVEGGPEAEENGVFYLLRDHLGSASVTVKEDSGALTKSAELRYKPWGEDRPASDAFNETQSPSNRRFTGQRTHDELGLYYYKARWYDPALGRFVQPDSIVPDPGNPIDWDRYSYVRNNPVKYIDPTGYYSEDEIMKFFKVDEWDKVLAFFEKGGALEGRWGWLEILRQANTGDEIHIVERNYSGANAFEDKNLTGGYFRIIDDQLFIENENGEQLDIFAAGSKGANYVLKHFISDRTSSPYTGTIIGAKTRFSHLKVEDWNVLLDPFEWIDISKFYLGGAATIAFGVASIQAGASLCTSVVGCVGGSILIGSGVMEIGAGGGLIYGGYKYTKIFLEEALEVTP